MLSKANPGATHHTSPRRIPAHDRRVVRLRGRLEPVRLATTPATCAPRSSKTAVAWWSFFGVFVSCVALETVGAAAATVVSPGAALGSNPTGAFTGR